MRQKLFYNSKRDAFLQRKVHCHKIYQHIFLLFTDISVNAVQNVKYRQNKCILNMENSFILIQDIVPYF